MNELENQVREQKARERQANLMIGLWALLIICFTIVMLVLPIIIRILFY